MDIAKDPWGHHWSLAGKAGVGYDSADAEDYTSPDVYASECEKIFQRVWLIIGRESEIPHPGDFIKRVIYPTKTEVFVVRGKDGNIRTFHNACAHRGATLVRAEAGKPICLSALITRGRTTPRGSAGRLLAPTSFHNSSAVKFVFHPSTRSYGMVLCS